MATIYDVQLKKGMKAYLTRDNEDAQAKAGDQVKITSVKAMGLPSDGFSNDYENIRVSNGKFSWRISREDISMTPKKGR